MDGIDSKRTILVGALVAAIAVGLTACEGAGSTSSGSTQSRAASYGRLLAYARCMRSHGVPDYPDPSQGNGSIGIALPDSNSPQSQTASHDCRSLAPPGPTAAGRAQALAQELTFSRCMRSHGVPNFPDPPANGSNLSLNGTAVDKGSPQFQRAYQSCRPDLGSGGPAQQAP
jgi:hypothetical protein